MGGTGPAGGWRIDELAQRAGVSVDTIRFYQREGLVQPGLRRGKSMRYGPAHLERLQRIAELRAGHFTLTAIGRMVAEGRLVMLDRLFGDPGPPRSRQQLVEESGLAAELVEELEAVGFINRPADRGATDYDGADVRALQAIRELTEMGTPPAVVPVVMAVYVRHMRALQRDLITTLAGEGDLPPDLSRETVTEYRRRATVMTDGYLSRWDVIVDYLHHRAVERLVYMAQSAEAPAAAVPRPGHPAPGVTA